LASASLFGYSDVKVLPKSSNHQEYDFMHGVLKKTSLKKQGKSILEMAFKLGDLSQHWQSQPV
jgi:hypothetical protein